MLLFLRIYLGVGKLAFSSRKINCENCVISIQIIYRAFSKDILSEDQ